jgi:hypothetical protein
MKKKKWSKEEKLAILKKASEKGEPQMSGCRVGLKKRGSEFFNI